MTFDHHNLRMPTPEPLPASFEAELRAIDERLHLAVTSPEDAVPKGLSERVYEASVGLLPKSGRLRLAGTQATRHVLVPGAQRWARFAMAAALLLAVGLGVWLVQRSMTPGAPPSNIVAHNGAAGERAAKDAALVKALESLSQGQTAELESRVSHLLDTHEVSSFDELNGELSMLVAAMEREM